MRQRDVAQSIAADVDGDWGTADRDLEPAVRDRGAAVAWLTLADEDLAGGQLDRFSERARPSSVRAGRARKIRRGTSSAILDAAYR